jgi:membrane protease YdiL (CAAX protease family)
MTIKTFIKQRPVSIYYSLVFAISWGAVLVTIGLNGMPTNKEQMEAMLPVVIVAMLLGPSISGLLMIGLIDGKPGFRDLKTRLFKWRVDTRWYVIALLLAPVTIMAVLMALSMFSQVYLPGIFTRDDKMAFLMMGLFSGVLVGICEELGWTGFVTPRLRQRYSILTTGLIIGVLWGAWHILPMAILPSVAYSGSLSPIIYIAIRTISFLVGGLVAFRVLMLWVYDRTESLLMLILMHIGLTTVNIIYEPEAIGGISNFIYDFVGAALWWIVVAVVAVANGWLLSRRVLFSKKILQKVMKNG